MVACRLAFSTDSALGPPASMNPAAGFGLMWYNTCGLWSLLAGFNVQVYHHPHCQFLKGDALHRVGMKVHFTAGVGLNEPVTAIDKQAHNPSPRARARLFHDPTTLA